MDLLKHDDLRWKHYAGEAQFDHPISYWGALVLFNLYAPNGSLVEGLARDGRVVDHQTIEPILKSRARHAAD